MRAFRSGLFATAYWRLRSGPMRRLAEAYVPFWLYRVHYQTHATRKTRFFAIDAVRGTLDLFEFPSVPADEQIVATRTRNRLEPRLDPEAATELLRTKVLRVLFQQGFFKMRAFTLEIDRDPLEFYLPYWLAFYGDSTGAKCRVLDAVRRRVEGAKAASFFEEWLTA